MASPRRELFIYYRVHAGAESHARVLLDTLQRELMQRVRGLRARWLRKDEHGSGTSTWMETYTIDPRAVEDATGVDAALQAEIERATSALLACIDGERHVEAFVVPD